MLKLFRATLSVCVLISFSAQPLIAEIRFMADTADGQLMICGEAKGVGFQRINTDAMTFVENTGPQFWLERSGSDYRVINNGHGRAFWRSELSVISESEDAIQFQNYCIQKEARQISNHHGNS